MSNAYEPGADAPSDETSVSMIDDSDSPRAVASRLWGGTPVIPPFCVEFAKSVEDIQALMALCREGSPKVGGRGDGTSVPMAVRSVPVLGKGQGNSFIGQGLVLEPNVGATLNLTEYPGWKGLPYRYNPDRKSVTCLSTASAFAVQTWLIIQHDRQLPCVPVAVDLRSNSLRIGGLLCTGSIGNWSVKQGPLAAHVLSLQVVTGAGEYRDLRLDDTATDEDQELAQAILGGYGGFAVIVSAELATEEASTPLPLPGGLATSAEHFMSEANQRAEESLDAGFLTGICLLETFNVPLLRRPVYAWLQARHRIGETAVASTGRPVTVAPINHLESHHQERIARIFEEVKRDIEDIDDAVLRDTVSFGHWFSALINKAIACLGIALGRYATAREGAQGQTWPPRTDFNIWLNLFFNGPTKATEFLTALVDRGIGTKEQQELLRKQPEPLTWAPMFITPILRSKFDQLPMMVLPPPPAEGEPDHGTQWVYFVGIYPGANDPDKAGQLQSYMANEIYAKAKELGATIYQVGSVPVSGEQHFGERWPEVARLKRKYDPDNILANGYRLYDLD